MLMFFISSTSFADTPEAFEPGEETEDKTGLLNNVARVGENILDFVTWEKNGFVFTVYPALAANQRSGFVYGLMPAIKWNNPGYGKVNTVTINAEASTKGMRLLQLEHEWYFYESWLTRGKAVFDSREDQFWMNRVNEDFLFERTEMSITWEFLRNVTSSLWAGSELLASRNRFPGEEPLLSSIENLPGQEGGWFAGIAPKIVFDSRHRSLSPQRGTWLQATYQFIGPAGLGDYEYNRTTFDGRRYFQLEENFSTVAVQGLLDYSEASVPFYEAPRLGGKERLRGIGHPLRETGNAVWMVRAELRQHLWWRFGGVMFAGMGRASGDFQSPLTHVVGSFGGGVRFRILPDDPLNVRFDIGVSTMGTSGFFISLKEAF